MDEPTRALKARYVFPGDGPPVEDGVVTICGSTILSVGRDAHADVIEDLGNVALLPGLINAHTHLEFSDLADPLGNPGTSLPNWIRQVVAYRASGERDIGAAVNAGLAESAAAGTAAIGEIASTAVPVMAYANSPMPLVAFHELIGLSAERGAAALADVDDRLIQWASSPSQIDNADLDGLEAHRTGPSRAVTHGLSPHAPYSIHRDVVAACGVNHTLPVAMHLAESPEELELLASGTGPFVDLLKDLGAWDASAIRRGTRPLDYLKLLAACDRSLIIHGNYLDDDEIQFLAANRARMTVVYCPRTHAYFEHSPYPLAKMLAAGVRVALGTDSRASNPDLNVWDEMRCVARAHPGVSYEDILWMATNNGAFALGLGHLCGSLSVGKEANMMAMSLQGETPQELLHSDTSHVANWIRGVRTARESAKERD